MEINQSNLGKNQIIINNESGTVNVGQIHKYTDLQKDENVYLYKEVASNEQNKFVLMFIMACVVPGVGLVADMMQIAPALSLPIWIYIVVFIIIFLVTVILYFDNVKLMLADDPKEDECMHLYADKLFSKNSNGYTIYTHRGPCIYPDCSGEVVISNSPERYNGNYSFFGKCSLAGKQHSYGIDYNFKAYPVEVDWRAMPRPRK